MTDDTGWHQITLSAESWQRVRDFRASDGAKGRIHIFDDGGLNIGVRCEVDLDAAYLSLFP